jgi:putative SOS response-associated peptidase YedK
VRRATIRNSDQRYELALGIGVAIDVPLGGLDRKSPIMSVAFGFTSYAIAMKDGSPFGLGGIWENWKDPTSGEWIRTFATITTDANELVAEIHDRMPLILAPSDYSRSLSDEPNPHDLMRPFPAEPMRMWPISTRVNKPESDDPSIIEPIELSAA